MTQSEYAAQALIHKALYPRWNYTGGYIIAKVDGSEVTLQGYTDPEQQESEILICKVKDSLSWEPIIYWQRIGSTSEPASLPLLSSETKHKQERISHSKTIQPEQKQVTSSDSVSKFEKNELAGNLLETVSKVRKEAETKATKDIQSVVGVAKETRRALENKVAKDIRAVAKVFEDTKKQAEQYTQVVAKSVEETHRQIGQYLDQAAQGAGQVVSPLQKSLTEFWNRYWLERLFNLIIGIDLEKAKQDVEKIREDYPTFQVSQIAERCIQEKVIWATATGLIGGLVPGVGLGVDLLATSPLLVEMVYQIAVAYGFEDLEDPARKGELLAVFGLALGKDKIVHLGLGFLLKQSPIPSWVIDASTNVLMFQILGYTACEFYEAKVNPLTSEQALTVLQEEIEAYSEKVISQREAIREVVNNAVSMREQVALI